MSKEKTHPLADPKDPYWSTVVCDSKVCKGRGKVELHAVKAARRMKD